MNANTKDLQFVTRELLELAEKQNWSKRDKDRNVFLLSAAATLRSNKDITLRELEIEQHNETSIRNGFEPIEIKKDGLTVEERAEARSWQQFLGVETRDVEGNPVSRLGTYNTSGGTFIPTEFFGRVISQMAAHDPLFDEDSCTVVNSKNGRPITVPTIGDIEVEASIVSENTLETPTDIFHPSQSVIGVYSFKTPRWTVSYEAAQDIDEVIGTTKLFEGFASDRLRRGIAKKLLLGTGTNEPLGLINSLVASGVSPIVASGSSGNTGGSESGATSIGSKDCANLFYSVNSAYRASKKCCWLMNDSTLAYLAGIISKLGLPLVQWQGGEGFILGKPVKVSPSMPSIGASNISVIFGDLSYWITNIVTGTPNGFQSQYIQKYTEAPDLVDNGMFGLRAFLRAGGALAANDPNSPAPMNYIIQHS